MGTFTRTGGNFDLPRTGTNWDTARTRTDFGIMPSMPSLPTDYYFVIDHEGKYVIDFEGKYVIAKNT